MSEKIRIYRENLFFGPWEKSLETTAALYNIASNPMHSSSSNAGTLANTAPKGALKAPATLMLGQKDLAFDQRLALDGAKEFMVRGSQVVVVKGAGHWYVLSLISLISHVFLRLGKKRMRRLMFFFFDIGYSLNIRDAGFWKRRCSGR